MISHIGRIKDLISMGHTDPSNIYPATHIFVGMASLISGINVNFLALLLPLVFYILVVSGVFIFTKSFIGNCYDNILYLILPASLIYYLGWLHFTILPNFLFFALIPLTLFVLLQYLKNRKISTSATLVVFLLIMPFGHPFVVVFIIYILFLIVLKDFLNKKKVVNSSPFVVSVCTFLAWFIYNAGYTNSFRQIYKSWINSITEPVMVEGLEKMSKLNLQGIELVRYIFIFYGRYIIPLFFVLILILYLIKKRDSIKRERINRISKLIIMLVLFGVFQLGLVFNTFISHNPHRMFDLNYIVFSLIPLFAISLHELFLTNIKKTKAIIIVSVIFTSAFTLSMFGAFDSPYVYHPNQEATYNEVVGAGWLLKNKDEKPIYDTLGSFGNRFSDLFLEKTEKDKRKDILHSAKVQDHFGYDKNKHFNEKNEYIVLTTLGELLYQTVYKKVGRYNASDFEKFRNDLNVIKIYDSLNIEIYKS